MARVLDLFCGAVGGWSHGLHRAGYRTVAACEIDPWRRAVFAQQFPARMYEDVRELTADRLLADLGILPDIIVGSPPCQDVSAANTKGCGIDGHRSGLFWEALRLVDEIRPVWLALENSPRLRVLGYDALADDLEALGYTCWPLVVGARHVGANHRRDRVWIIAADAYRISGGWITGAERQSRPETGPHALHPDAARVGSARPVGQPTAKSQKRPGSSRNDLSDARDAEIKQGLRQPGLLEWGGTEPAQVRLHDAAHSDREGLAVGSRLTGDHGTELPAALRDIGLAWPDWNGGLAGLAAACAAAGVGHVDDGGITTLPAGLRNRAIAALGDAIVPEIPEAIGRTMRGLTAARDCA